MASAKAGWDLFPSVSASLLIVSVAISTGPLWPTVSAPTVVKHLPGFHGPLPFHLETGYVKVDEENDVNLFYYFIESEQEPELDPVMVWLTGGPGCSGLSGLAFEIGPLQFDVAGYSDGLPTLLYRPHSWTKVCNIIFLDSPVGTGFSYSSSEKGWQTGDTKSTDQLYTFIKKWLIEHPKYLSNPLYIGGDSYSGMIVPIVAQLIANGINEGDELNYELKGYLLGNPKTGTKFEDWSFIPFAHGVGLISDELYESTMKSCGREYASPRNAQCANYLQSVQECIEGLNQGYILEPLCFHVSPKPNVISGDRRPLENDVRKLTRLKTNLPLECRSSGNLLSHFWANNDTVREALGILKETVQYWLRCNEDLPYVFDVPSAIGFHLNVTSRGYRALVYSGDHDMTIPFVGTQAWIRSLNFSIVDDWRPWTVGGQVAGFTRTYSNNMTFATVKGGGHTAPEYRPKECLGMVQRWLSGHPL